MAESTQVVPGNKKKRLDFYHSANQLRFDSWHRLEELTGRINKHHVRKVDIASLSEKISETINLLQTIEQYNAFPSEDGFKLILQLFEDKDYKLLAKVVSRAVRAVTSGTYRSREINLRAPVDEAHGEASQYHDDDSNHTRPYFEVLFVDENSQEDIRSIRKNLKELRRPEDQFIYDVVVVPSLEDALIAVLFNYNIQSVVIRYGFPLHSVNHLDILQRYLARINEIEFEDSLDSERGPLLGNLLAELRPELDLYLVTDGAVEDIAGKVTQKFRAYFLSAGRFFRFTSEYFTWNSIAL